MEQSRNKDERIETLETKIAAIFTKMVETHA